jgi:hypothetical protein
MGWLLLRLVCAGVLDTVLHLSLRVLLSPFGGNTHDNKYIAGPPCFDHTGIRLAAEAFLVFGSDNLYRTSSMLLSVRA